MDQALAELDSERPEVAVVRVRLGDTGELEAIKRIREVNVHVILLATATPEDGHLATAALGLGATDYLLKPVDFDYLGRVIEKALTAAAPIMGFAEVTPEPTVSSPQAASVHPRPRGVPGHSASLPGGARPRWGPRSSRGRSRPCSAG